MGVGLGRDQSFLILIMEALRYQDLWSHMGEAETEGTRELVPSPCTAGEGVGRGSTDGRKGAWAQEARLLYFLSVRTPFT